MKKNLMTRAHELARGLEGGYRARMSLALQQAWMEIKREEEKGMKINISHQPSGGREWIAEITGHDPKYTFKRKFLPIVSRNWSSSGKTGTTSFELEAGKVYEINEPWGKRRFVEIQGGELASLTAEEILSRIA